MRAQTARPLRALAALMTIYVGGRIGVAARYPQFAVIGLQPADALQPARTGPVRSASGGPGIATADDGGAVDFRLIPADWGFGPFPMRAALVSVAKQERSVVAMPVRQIGPGAGVTAAPATVIRRAASKQLLAGGSLSPHTSALARAPSTTPIVPQGGGTPNLPVGRERGRALSGSTWLLVRDGSRGASLAPLGTFGGTLGGSQAGARVSWRPTAAPIFLTVRASAALATRDSEIAPGVGVRGKGVGVILEQRLRLERGRSSQTALVAYGGVDGVRAPLGFRLDGYAQAGAVSVSDPALFVDGAARAEREVVRFGRARLGIGAGAWGGAQPGVARVDLGPQAVLHAPLGSNGVRLSAEYRFRVAGNARPVDGVSMTLGADF